MRFKVKGTHIKHGAGEKAVVYGPGDTIELSEKQAEPILHCFEPESSAENTGKKATPKAGKKRSIKERLLGKGKKKEEAEPSLDDSDDLGSDNGGTAPTE